MKPGAIIPMTSCEANFPNGTKYKFGCKQSRSGERMMFLFLGTTMDSEKFNVEDILKRMGWEPAP